MADGQLNSRKNTVRSVKNDITDDSDDNNSKNNAKSDKSKNNKSNKKEDKSIKPGRGRKSRDLAAYWLDQIGQYEDNADSFIRQGDAIIDRYRDVRKRVALQNGRKMNVLWSTTKILLPALYSRCPIPIIDRTFLDRDPIARLSSQIAERAIRNQLKVNNFHRAIKRAVLDRLLPGRGVVWCRYDSEIADSVSLSSNQTGIDDDLVEAGQVPDKDDAKLDQLEDTGEQVLSEMAVVDYVNQRDFITLPTTARVWEEVQTVGKYVLMTRAKAEERFGKEISEELPYSDETAGGKSDSDSSSANSSNDRRIKVAELWNKTDGMVYWVCKGYPYLCDVREDFLKLSKFFPCPEPLVNTYTNDTLFPVADYLEWQDQAMQIDELTNRIANLSKAVKVAGTYDGANRELARLMSDTVENKLIAVEGWQGHKEKGGIEGSVSFMPIDKVREAIKTLMEVRRQAIEDLDMITGITDIMRGTTDSRETLGGLRLKTNNTGTRLSDQQEEVARFCRDTVQILTEIVCKHFTKEALVEASGILYEEQLDPKNIISDMLQRYTENQSNNQPPTPLPQPEQSDQPDQAQEQQPPQPQQGGNVIPFNGPQQPQQPQQPPQQQTPQLDRSKMNSVMHNLAQKEIDNKIDTAIDLLRKDVPRRYRVDIELDSTIMPDIAQAKENTTAMMETFGGFIKSAQEIAQGLPEAMPLMGKMLQSAVRTFRAGRDLEYAVDDFVEKMIKKAAKIASAPPPPDPEQIKADFEMKKMEYEGKMQEQNDQREIQIKQAELAADAKRAEIETQVDKQKAMLDNQLAEAEFKRKMAEINANHSIATTNHRNKMIDMYQTRLHGDAQHRNKMEAAHNKTNNKVSNNG